MQITIKHKGMKKPWKADLRALKSFSVIGVEHTQEHSRYRRTAVVTMDVLLASIEKLIIEGLDAEKED